MNDGHKTDEQPRWTPQQISMDISEQARPRKDETGDGLLIAEVEVADESETFALPSWAGVEVSNDPRYFNANLVSNPYKNWRVPNVDEVSFALRNPRR
jgi:hypothetical protein